MRTRGFFNDRRHELSKKQGLNRAGKERAAYRLQQHASSETDFPPPLVRRSTQSARDGAEAGAATKPPFIDGSKTLLTA
jgi:hypothetical protein